MIMSAAMDLYFNTNDSLQDMLDIDIKSEVDTLVGGHNDLSGFSFNDLPPLEFDDNEILFISSNSNHSNGSFNLDFSDDSSTMVNPNAVMPISLAQNMRSPSPQLKRSHLTFSPCSIKIAGFKTAAATDLKRDLLDKLSAVEDKKPNVKSVKTKPLVMVKPVIKAVNKCNPTIITFKNSVQNVSIATQSVNNVKVYTHNHNRNKVTVNRTIHVNDLGYPKPAYSYSCLIAMALKNSCNGCLPVSEIYNFMCRHFPYFKTAPSGWKNSVRHNLSLNKCFEKIEKPAINGTQRKGCLWAMNPNKINKMDEEVQKWSKKDPIAIRKAMVNPENLEYLERGDLKFTYEEADTFGDSCGSAESEEESETEPDIELENEDQSDYICIDNIKMEEEIDIEEHTLYDENDIEDDKEGLRVEVALAQKELLHYESTIENKRRKLFLIQN